MKVLQTIIKHPLECIAGAAFFIMAFVIFIQVICRYVFNSPLTWPEELARLLFLWTSFLGATIGLRIGSHYKVEIFVDLLPKKVRAVYLVLIDFLLLLLISYWGWQGIKGLGAATLQRLPALNISMMWRYLPLPICSSLMLLVLFIQLYRDINVLLHSNDISYSH